MGMNRSKWVCLTLGICLLTMACKEKPRAVAVMGGETPTQRDGRGEPSLDDPFRAAAWITIDGKSGKFKEADGGPLVQWIIDEPVSASPTFSLRVHEPLLGSKVEFEAALQLVDDPENKSRSYALKAKEGKFETGKEYKLLSPGDDFEVREAGTDKIVTSIDPLAPGQYLIAASVTGADKKGTALAVTYFTVK